jgi:hypothetical protein
MKEKQKLFYDRRYVKELPRLDVGEPLRVAPLENSNTKEWKPGGGISCIGGESFPCRTVTPAASPISNSGKRYES